jgi:hypothetical protein
MSKLAISTPNIQEAFYDTLVKAFKPIEITPDTPINDIMFSAGQKSVIDWITAHRTRSIITGTLDDPQNART